MIKFLLGRYVWLGIVVFVCLCICQLKIQAQGPIDIKHDLDSLLSVIKTAKNDSLRTELKFKAFTLLMRSNDTTKAKSYLNDSKSLAKSPYEKALSQYMQAIYYHHTNHEPLAKEAYLKAEKMYSSFKHKRAYQMRATIWQNYGLIAQEEDNEAGYLKVLLEKAVPMAQLSGDKGLLGSFYRSIGLVFRNSKELPKAETYFLKAIHTLEKSDDIPELVSAYLQAADVYILTEKPVKAKALLDKAYKFLKASPSSSYMISYYHSLGNYYKITKNYRQAVVELDHGIVLAKKLGKRYEEYWLMYKKYLALKAGKAYALAKKILLKVKESEEFNQFAKNRLLVIFEMGEINNLLNNLREAYKWKDLYADMNDSLNTSRLKKELHVLEIKYQRAEQQRQIVHLEAQKQKALLTAKTAKINAWLFASLSLLLALSIIFSISYYRSRKNLAEQKQLVYMEKLNVLEQQQKLDLAQAMLVGEERERKRVAADLHDGLGGMLSGIKMRFSNWMEEHHKSDDGFLSTLVRQLDTALTDLRQIARNLMPETLLKLGISEALADLCDSLNTEKTAIEFQAIGLDKNLPMAFQLGIYRIVQEALANALKHADAKHILVQCSQNQNIFLVTVEDDGRGFDVNVQKGKGLGLTNLKNRVEALKGALDIQPSPNKGTTINIEFNVEGK